MINFSKSVSLCIWKYQLAPNNHELESLPLNTGISTFLNLFRSLTFSSISIFFVHPSFSVSFIGVLPPSTVLSIIDIWLIDAVIPPLLANFSFSLCFRRTLTIIIVVSLLEPLTSNCSMLFAKDIRFLQLPEVWVIPHSFLKFLDRTSLAFLPRVFTPFSFDFPENECSNTNLIEHQ